MNVCVRICSGAMRSTPINCLQHYCNEMPLKRKYEQLCLYYRAYLSTFNDHSTLSAIGDSWPERYPENANFCSFNMKVKTFFSQPNMNINKIVEPNTPIWLVERPNIDYQLYFLCRKNGNLSLIKTSFLNIINTDYENFNLMYTDGFKYARIKFGSFRAENTTKQSIAINELSFPFAAELYAILCALRWIAIYRPPKNLIFTDCFSVLQALDSKTRVSIIL